MRLYSSSVKQDVHSRYTLAVAGDVFDGVFLCCPLGVMDEIWDLIESVSEGFLTYSREIETLHFFIGKYNKPSSFLVMLKTQQIVVRNDYQLKEEHPCKDNVSISLR